MAIDTPARIAVLGGGPIGLEAALYARYLGFEVDIYERGRVAENVCRWGHVLMFTPFEQNRSPLGLAALKAQDSLWRPPSDEAFLTGRDFAEHYLIPLAKTDLLVDSLHERTEVVTIARDHHVNAGMLDVEDDGQSEFRILLNHFDDDGHSQERIAMADAVIDTTGTYSNHRWLGRSGLPAVGERTAAPRIEYGLADVLGTDRDRYASRNILLVGSGLAAATNLVALAELASQSPDTWITWIVADEMDHKSPRPVSEPTEARLARQARLCRIANDLAGDGGNHVTFHGGTWVEALAWHEDLQRFTVRLEGHHPGEMEFDRVIGNVGYHAENGIHGELQIDRCLKSRAPMSLAMALAAQGDRQYPDQDACGASSLVTSEPDFYILGEKSYGRDERFVIFAGLVQIRQLFTIIGDRVDLDLYATMKGLY